MSDVLITSQEQIDAHRITAATYIEKLENQQAAYLQIKRKVGEAWSGSRSEGMQEFLQRAADGIGTMVDETKPVNTLMESVLQSIEKNL